MKKPRQSKATSQASTLSRAEKIKLGGGFLGALTVLALLFHITCVQGQKSSIQKTVEKWKTLYHVDETQAARIRQIEFDFHGSGSPFAARPSHNREETGRHHEEIAALMSTENGTRFIRDMEKSGDRH